MCLCRKLWLHGILKIVIFHSPMTIDYKTTVFLPKTDFPMRAGLAQKEPEILKFWEEKQVYQQLAARDVARHGQFILHDGPPYANGNIHIGHATNKILKDVANRAEALRGKRINYIPGWDCHGLPIEWKIEEGYREKKLDKDAVPVLRFRAECRDFAAHWLEVQREEFKRLGVMGDWENPYATMHFQSEAIIAGEIHKFLMNGSLYQGERAVMWSTVEKTALADAEVEYHDHTSDVVWVAFPVKQTNLSAIADAELVIWTTTPWTMPANRAIAYGAEFDYGVFEITAVADGSLARTGQKIVIALALVDAVQKAAGITAMAQRAAFKGAELEGTLAAHPLSRHAEGAGHYNFDVRVLPAEFVTTESGTGLVHIAPSHGLDDFTLGKEHGLEIPYTVEPDGRYVTHLPIFGGARIYNDQGKKGDANKRVMAALEAVGGLLAHGQYVHSYPHSWRSKAPLIFRTTPQWFIAMDDDNQIRAQALRAIKDTRWVPGAGETRIRSMVESRPDWCISRQRTWGVPIAIFVNKKTREPLRDMAVCQRIVEMFTTEGADAWFTHDAQDFLGTDYNAADYEQVRDIVDVWFESGSTHAFVFPKWEHTQDYAADLYLEGSDQHRGWFQSSLLESVGSRGRAPFKTVLTHGFVLDEQGRKMSKSVGNVVAPQKVMEQYGADILRLWVCNTNYSEDIRIGSEILKQQSDLYRRLRNTLRYLLGALADFDPRVPVDVAAMPELERWVLHRIAELDVQVRGALDAFDYNKLFTALHEFCNTDLSAFYFDVRKDSLYCDAKTAPKRQATLWVMNQLFLHLTVWLAPILSFTCEEAWQHYAHRSSDSVHLRVMPSVPADWCDDVRGAEWDKIRAMRSVVTTELELMRANKIIGSALEARVVLTVPDAEIQALLARTDFQDLCIVSALETDLGALNVAAQKIVDAEKCDRCWQYLPDVGSDKRHITLCVRCADAVAEQEKLAA